jgi:acyl-CoA thioester hydrolase
MTADLQPEDSPPMTAAAARVYEYPINVVSDDIDFMGHVNNAVYLKWVQAAVIDYWQRVAPPEAVAQHLWVALKHEITYRRPAFLDDGIIAEVIAESAQGARTFFSTLFKRGEEVVAEVKSSWCCLDAATLRPARLAKDVLARFLP